MAFPFRLLTGGYAFGGTGAAVVAQNGGGVATSIAVFWIGGAVATLLIALIVAGTPALFRRSRERARILGSSSPVQTATAMARSSHR